MNLLGSKPGDIPRFKFLFLAACQQKLSCALGSIPNLLAGIVRVPWLAGFCF